MTWQVRYGRFVYPASSVDIHGIDHLKRGLPAVSLKLALVLSGRSEEQTTVGGKSESPEERRQCLVGVQASILHAHANTRIRLW